jgi:hypothetical protein
MDATHIHTMPQNFNSVFETQLEKQKQDYNSDSVNGPNSQFEMLFMK